MPRIQPKQEPVNPDLSLTNRLIAEYRQLWVDQLREAGVPQMHFSRLSLVALTQVAAVVAVDVGMQPEQFIAMCLANFSEAHKRAPRFT